MRGRAISSPAIVLALICAMYAFTYMDRVNVSTAAVIFGAQFHLSNTQIGLVFSAFAYPYLLSQIAGGWVSDRIGARWTLTVSALIWGIATILTGTVHGFKTMIAARVLLGIGEAATFPAATRAMSWWTEARKRGFAQGITHASARLGNAVTPPLVVWLMTIVTWRGSFIVTGVAGLAWGAVWFWYFRENPADHPSITKQNLEVLPAYSPHTETGAHTPWGPLIRRMAPATAVYFCYGWTLWLYLAWVPLFFVHRYNLDLKKSAWFSACVFFAGVLGDMSGGMVSDWLFQKTGNLDVARRDLILGAYLASLAFMLPVLWLHSLNGVAFCLSGAFFFSEFTIGPMWAIPMDIAPQFSGSASGIMNIGSPLAAVVSPLVFGYIIDLTQNWTLPFVGSIGLLFLGALMIVRVQPSKKFQTPETYRVS
jgi:sugar phosphate permease